MMLRRGILLIAVALSGCVSLYTANQYPGADARQSAACELTAEGYRDSAGYVGLGPVTIATDRYNRAFDACMRSKGYARAPGR
jgi:hypothetical protein